MDRIEMVLVCGFANFIWPKLKSYFPSITLPFPHYLYPSSFSPNPNLNYYSYPYSNSFLLPI